MKIRTDYVTNSSSSSFIIAKRDVTRGHLLDILLEMANEEEKKYDCNYYSWNDVTGNGVGHFRIFEYTDWEKYRVYNWNDITEKEYSDVFVVKNEDCGRYDWDVVEKVLNKYGLPLIYGGV